MTIEPAAQRPPVRYEVSDGHIAVITLDRPAARNAVNGEVARLIDEYVQHTNDDADIRAVVLTSSMPNVFCAGADLAEIARGNAAALGTPTGGFAGLIRAHRRKPWIAAVEGAALAGGFEIVLSCDMVVATAGARFGLPEVKRGLYAGAGGPFRMQRVLPRNVALEVIATGDPLSGERAHALGMVNRLAEPGETLAVAIELAKAIAINAPMAVRESMDIVRRAAEMTEDAFWAASDETAGRVFSSADAQEGPRAFLEKREPVWTGQ